MYGFGNLRWCSLRFAYTGIYFQLIHMVVIDIQLSFDVGGVVELAMMPFRRGYLFPFESKRRSLGNSCGNF
jgi:hypothetical protein